MGIEKAIEETTFSFSSQAPRPGERREEARHLTILRVGLLIVDDRRELCLIRNISAGGLMVHAYSHFTIGQRAAIEFKTDTPTWGEVTWIEGSNIGIEFDEPVDVEEILANQSPQEGSWRPRLPRVEIDRMGTIRDGAHTYGISTRNISQGGIRLEIDQPIEAGSDVVLTLDRFRPIQGVVRWYQEGACGVSFNQVIPFRELIDWIRR